MSLARSALPFRSVNVPGSKGYCAGLQRHHVLPRQLLDMPGIGGLIDQIGTARLGFHDFCCNGLLLPATDEEAVRRGLPLHRGPHNCYNELVIERMGQIEAGWQKRRRGPGADGALAEALMRIDLLQRALRRRLLDPARWHGAALHARDPALDFSHLDRMADMLWAATIPAPA
ncbi:AHH domain-containing protein [Novosphingobium sp.]|uniref:AHH domain-containing protein n=1 Tax=Novosphingobium sp. TaxID=1874826 RepID=UPI0033404284